MLNTEILPELISAFLYRQAFIPMELSKLNIQNIDRHKSCLPS